MDFDDLDAAEDALAEAAAAQAAEEASRPKPHPALERCTAEMAKVTPSWQFITMEHFMANHERNEPGLRYGLKFPHTREQLASAEYGAAWLTKAFQAATVLPKDNRVTKIISTKQLGGGGAADKALVVVEYEKPSEDLHTKLFMKFPYPMDKERRSDRMNSSVMLQQDCPEVDALRVLEAHLPFKVAKYYFADISNMTTNFIILTQFIEFGDPAKPLKEYRPFEIEPCYEKFLDDEQWGDRAIEYYREMTWATATMSGYYKAGKLGTPEQLGRFFFSSKLSLPQGGLSEPEFKHKMKMGDEFITQVARHHFPADVVTPAAMQEWKRILNIANTYTAELAHWAHSNDDYLVLCHGNMNADNTFWSRDQEGKLVIGVIDWGGLSVGPIPRILWWSYYAAEFHFFDKHLDELLEYFCRTYKEQGGPEISVDLVKKQWLVAAINQCIGLLGAIPQIYRVIKKDSWGDVKDRNDPRLKGHFLTRMYVQGFVLISTMIQRWNLGKVLDDLLAEAKLPKKELPVIP